MERQQKGVEKDVRQAGHNQKEDKGVVGLVLRKLWLGASLESELS